MTFEEYTKNIYRIKNQIQKLDDDFYAQPDWHENDTTAYDAERSKLCDELDKACKA